MMFDPTDFINNFRYIGIFALLILGVIGFPFREDTTFMLCGFLIASAVIKPLPSFLVGYIGLLMIYFHLKGMVEDHVLQKCIQEMQLHNLRGRTE
jgi:hypothetical protein